MFDKNWGFIKIRDNGSGKNWIYGAFTNRTMGPHYSLVYKVSDFTIGLYDPNLE